MCAEDTAEWGDIVAMAQDQTGSKGKKGMTGKKNKKGKKGKKKKGKKKQKGGTPKNDEPATKEAQAQGPEQPAEPVAVVVTSDAICC